MGNCNGCGCNDKGEVNSFDVQMEEQKKAKTAVKEKKGGAYSSSKNVKLS
jgi:hypothetical protein